MRHCAPRMIIVASILALTGPSRGDAQDEWLNSDPTAVPPSVRSEGPPAWTPPQAARQDRAVERQRSAQRSGWLGERADSGRPPTLDELRAHLISRGIDPVAIDQRIARIREARRQGVAEREAARAARESDAEREALSKLDRNVDATAGAEARWARQRELRGDFGRFGRQVPVAAGREPAQVPSRLAPLGIPPHDLNVRLGRPSGASPDGSAPMGPAVGGPAGRVRSRR